MCIEATQTIQGVPYTVYLYIRVVHTTNQYEAHHTPIPGHTNITRLFTARANSNRICGARSEQRKGGGQDEEKGVKMGNLQFFLGGPPPPLNTYEGGRIFCLDLFVKGQFICDVQ